MQFYRFISIFCLLAVCALTSGCGGKVDPIILETSLQNAQSAVIDAQRLDAEVYAKPGIARAMKFLEEARGAQRAGDGAYSLELAFQAQMEAKIAGIQARQSIAQQQTDQTEAEIWNAIIQRKSYEVQTAQTRQAIAEELTRRALDRANRAEKQVLDAQAAADEAKKAARKSIRHHETQLAISKAQQALDFADEVGAPLHAPGDYRASEDLIAKAIALLQRDAFDDAANVAVQAKERARNARRASVKAADAESAKKTEAYTTAKLSIAAAQTEIDLAESVYASVHAADLFQRAGSALEQANISLNAENYPQAMLQAGESENLARQAFAAAEEIDRQRRAQEALEEQIAQAKDAIFKAEESIEGERKTDVPNLVPELYAQAETLLTDARRALTDEDYESAINAARRSLGVLGEAVDGAKRVEAVENRIIEAAAGLSFAEVEQSERGILIRFGGNLFNTGSAKLNPESLPLLNQFADVIKEFADYDVRIEGHSDSSGGAEANLKLTERRAIAFKTYLVEQCGAPEERLTTVGLGESVPIATEINRSGRAKNRRIDTIILTRR